ncbi:hypothetical protein Tco_0983729 [Tanacetum coccineum]
MKQDKAKQAVRDESLVSSNARVKIGNARVKIGTNNLRMDPSAKKGRKLTKSPSTSSRSLYSTMLSSFQLMYLKSTCSSSSLPSRKSRIHLLINYAALIWEDLQYQIDHRQSKVGSKEFMPYLGFTKAIIHHFMKKPKSISKREGLPYHLVKDDGMLDILKFVNKVFNGFLQRWEEATEEPAAPKKATTSSKKKLTKRKLVISDESDMSEGELEHRPPTRRIRTPSIVVLKEPPSVHIKKTQESSGKLKGIEMLSEVAQEELDTQKEIKASKRESRFQHKTGNSSEGAGLRSEVPDEQTRKSVVLNEEIKIKDDDEDDVSEEDEEESFSEEENVDKESEEEYDDDDNRSFDITNTDDERTESDSDDHEISKEGKKVAETEEEETANSEHEEDVTKGDDQKSDEEPKVDNQAKETEVEVPYLVKIKEKSEFL